MRFSEQLTEKGRRRFLFFCGLVTFSVISSIAYLIYGLPKWGDVRVLFFTIAPPIAYYLWISSALHSNLKEIAFFAMGFDKIPHGKILEGYDIAKQGDLAVSEVYRGTAETHPFKIIVFSISTGSGRSRRTDGFIGVEFETAQLHLPVQIYDQKNRLKPFFRKSRKLEWNEFHRYFKVYSKEAKDSFYQLDPDTMHDLVSVRKELGFAINIESWQNKIFIYVGESVFEGMFGDILAESDIFNGTASDEKLKLYHDNIEAFIKKLLKIFATLDYKLKV